MAPKGLNPLRLVTSLLLSAALVCGSLVLHVAASADAPAAPAAKKCKKAKKGATSAKKKKCKKKKKKPGAPTAPTIPPTTPQPPAGPGQPVLTVTDLTISPNPVLGENPSQGQVTISGPAPAGGQTVTLQSDNPSRASPPASIQVAAGQTTASFPISTTAGPTVTVTLTASIGPSSDTAQLTVKSAPSLIAVTLAKRCFTVGQDNNTGGNFVVLDVPAQVDTTVTMQSSDTNALTVSNAVVFSGSTTGQFTVTALQQSSSVTVTGTLGADPPVTSAPSRVLGAAEQPVMESVSLNPPSVSPGGSSTGTVTLDCEAQAGGALVALTSSNDEVDVPDDVTVTAGQRSATFPITTTPMATGSALITGTFNSTFKNATLTID